MNKKTSSELKTQQQPTSQKTSGSSLEGVLCATDYEKLPPVIKEHMNKGDKKYLKNLSTRPLSCNDRKVV